MNKPKFEYIGELKFKIDSRVFALFQELAGDKAQKAIDHACTLIMVENKNPARALADALEEFKLPNYRNLTH